jgi:hypothetical protein
LQGGETNSKGLGETKVTELFEGGASDNAGLAGVWLGVDTEARKDGTAMP